MNSVPDRLIDAAEQLFGERGIDGVSLRQISSAAGTANNYAVQYHFGDLLGLIRAITKKRMPAVEAFRASLLLRAKQEGRLEDTRTLLEILHRPVLEHTNSQGDRAYARFLSAALHSPVARNVASSDVFDAMPIAVHVLDRIAALHGDIPRELLEERLRHISLIMFNSLFNRFTRPADTFSDDALIENALDMAAAALVAPLSPAFIIAYPVQ